MLAEASLLVALSVEHGSGTEACLDAPRLKRGVEARLRRRVFVEPAQAGLRLVVTFERRADGTEARVDLFSMDGAPRGSRSLVTSGHCSALDDSLALSVALLVDQPPEPEPEAVQPPAQTDSAGTGLTPSPKPAAARPALTIPADVDAPREPWHVHAGVSGAATWGVLPGLSPSLSLYFKLVPRHFVPVLLQGEAFWSATAERDGSSGVRFRLLRAGLGLCPPVVEGTRGGASICVGQKLGWLEAEGYGFDHNAREKRLTYALTAGGEGWLRLLGPVSLRGYLGAEVPVLRDEFASSGSNGVTLFQQSPVAFAAELGLEVALR